MEPEVEVEMRTWDCGGQEVYKLTNRIFFGNRRAVYVCVYSLRCGIDGAALDGAVRDARMDGSTLDDAMHDVRCYAPQAPVVLVGTHADEAEEDPAQVDRLCKRFPGMVRCVECVSSAAPPPPAHMATAPAGTRRPSRASTRGCSLSASRLLTTRRRSSHPQAWRRPRA